MAIHVHMHCMVRKISQWHLFICLDICLSLTSGPNKYIENQWSKFVYSWKHWKLQFKYKYLLLKIAYNMKNIAWRLYSVFTKWQFLVEAIIHFFLHINECFWQYIEYTLGFDIETIIWYFIAFSLEEKFIFELIKYDVWNPNKLF